MGEIYSIINGGTPPYQIYLDSAIQGVLIDNLLPGLYYYEVIDANGCSFSNLIEIVDYTIVGISSLGKPIYTFTNPLFGDQLEIFTQEKIIQIDAFNSIGKLIPTQFDGNILQFEASFKGIIFLKIISTNNEMHYSIIKL